MKCILQEPRFDDYAVAELRIKDPEKYVWSTRDGDGIWGTTVSDYEELEKIVGKETVNKWASAEYENMEIEVPDSYWEESKGYEVRRHIKFNGEVEVVEIPLSMDSVVTVPCPYCQYPRDVEPDANYKVKCEGCGNPYEVASLI